MVAQGAAETAAGAAPAGSVPAADSSSVNESGGTPTRAETVAQGEPGLGERSSERLPVLAGLLPWFELGRLYQTAVVCATVTGASLVLLIFANYWFQLPRPDAVARLDNVSLVLLPLAAFAACLSAGVRNLRRARWGWWFLGLACLSWGAGQAAWTYYELTGHAVPFPSIADVGYLGFVPLAVVALAMMPTAPARFASKTRVVMDGAIIASNLLFVSWAFVLGPLYASGTGSWPEKVIGLAYPTGDLVLLTVVLIVLTQTKVRNRGPLLLVLIGLVAFSVADTGFALLNLEEAYWTGHPIDLGWILGFLLVAVAALDRRHAPTLAQRIDAPAGILVGAMPVIPLLVDVLVAAYKVVETGGLELFLLWNGLFGITLVGIRQLWIIVDNTRLNRHLDHTVKSKVELLNHISHEMRNPLTPIMLELYMLRTGDGAPLDARRERSLRVLERNFQRLNVFIQDVLDVSRIEAGRLRIEPAAIDYRRVLEEAVDGFEESAKAKGIKLAHELPQNLSVWGDATRLTQVLTNLLSNALKFTPRGGTIHLRSYVEENRAVTRVRDTGIGLTADQIRQLFQPFKRLHEAERIEGQGLGLFICKGMIEMHGGRIWAESPGPGRGSTFAFELPLPKAGASAT